MRRRAAETGRAAGSRAPRLPASALGLCLALACAVLAGPAPAQQPAQDRAATGQVPALRSPVLVIDYERLFNRSAFGRRVLGDIEAEGRALVAENDRIEAELSAEELELTRRRDALSPEAFRDLADAFDAKVQRLRAAQQAKAEAVGDDREAEEQRFRQLVNPIIARIMQEVGAVIVLDRRDSIVFVDAIDVTDTVLGLADQIVGDGENAPVPRPPRVPSEPGDAPSDGAPPSAPAPESAPPSE